MVTFRTESRFYSRTSAGKYPLDISEIRSAFALSETLPDKIRRFREERLARIVADETPVRLEPFPKIVLHIVPAASVQPGANYLSLELIEERSSNLRLMFVTGHSRRINFDGLLLCNSGSSTSTSWEYLQIFRAGILEAVDSHLLQPKEKYGKVIPSRAFEGRLIEAVNGYLSFLAELDAGLPVFIMLSLQGVTGYRMGTEIWHDDSLPIDRDTLLLPEILLSDYEQRQSEEILRPAFDAVWQACGFERSLNYDQQGKCTRR